MKHRFFIFTLATVVLVGVLAACSFGTMDSVRDTFGDTMENASQPGFSTAPEQTKPHNTTAQTTPRETTTTLTAAEAEAIALAHAGFTADQITGLRSEYEIDNGIPHYDVQFRKGLQEYEYEIHAQTGAVLSFDRDD